MKSGSTIVCVRHCFPIQAIALFPLRNSETSDTATGFLVNVASLSKIPSKPNEGSRDSIALVRALIRPVRRLP